MHITLEQLERAIRRCTPGAPDSYAGRIWATLEAQQDDPATRIARMPDGTLYAARITRPRPDPLRPG